LNTFEPRIVGLPHARIVAEQEFDVIAPLPVIGRAHER
jgi:hypothetical protein